MMDNLVIRREVPGDIAAIREVVAAAFHVQPIVTDLVEALRASTAWRADLSLVAERDGVVVGHVLATRGWLDDPDTLLDVLVLSPLSVAPSHQRQGIGGQLIEALCAVAAMRDEPVIFLEGSPDYYSAHGFAPACPAGFLRPSLRIPEPAFQFRALPSYASSRSGTLVYPEPFWALDCVGLR